MVKKKIKLYKPQILFIESGTYPFTILVFVNQQNDVVKKTLLKYFDLPNIEQSNILNTKKAKTCYLPESLSGKIMIRFVDLHEDCADCLPVIAHEMFHATEFLFDCIRLDYNEGSSEAFSYQIEYYCRQLLTKLK